MSAGSEVRHVSVASILHALLLLTTCSRALGAQEDTARIAAFRTRVAGFIKSEAARALPVGDTLLTWHDGHPVLFHTASRDTGGVQAGMLRADRMLGIADVRWSGTVPTSFHVSWLTPRSNSLDSVDIRGHVANNSLTISKPGRIESVIQLPNIPWAVADYGMEQLLLPLFAGEPPREPYPVAVLRPYGLKWDTLIVTRQGDVPGQSWTVVTWTDAQHEQWRMAILDRRHLLWLRRSAHPNDETLPLDGTSLGATFANLRRDLELATKPSPQK